MKNTQIFVEEATSASSNNVPVLLVINCYQPLVKIIIQDYAKEKIEIKDGETIISTTHLFQRWTSVQTENENNYIINIICSRLLLSHMQ